MAEIGMPRHRVRPPDADARTSQRSQASDRWVMCAAMASVREGLSQPMKVPATGGTGSVQVLNTRNVIRSNNGRVNRVKPFPTGLRQGDLGQSSFVRR
jgi:hypothetical protein